MAFISCMLRHYNCTTRNSLQHEFHDVLASSLHLGKYNGNSKLIAYHYAIFSSSHHKLFRWSSVQLNLLQQLAWMISKPYLRSTRTYLFRLFRTSATILVLNILELHKCLSIVNNLPSKPNVENKQLGML